MAGTIAAFAALLAAAAAVAPFIGAESIDARAAFRELLAGRGALSPDADILFFQRVPRVMLAGLAGGALALAGAVFQALLRNPLATPYTLGVSSGCALGATIAISAGALQIRWWVLSSVELFALAGGLADVLIVYLLARRRGHLSMGTLLLAGVTLGLISSASILLVRYLADPRMLVVMDRWLMGGIAATGYREVAAVLPLLAPGAALLLAQARKYDQLAFGDEVAAGRGVDVVRLQRLSFFGGSLVTASVVAAVGPIGFVGLIVPHAVRGILGPDHRLLLPAATLAGAAFLIACDTLARTMLAPTELPVGIITALLGGPFFLWVLVRNRS
ncbi:MAG: iron ABC transporter permease [Planctomycetes bacterium]|nr:iron ABC transporter permease [Planctomycetota bacterium]